MAKRRLWLDNLLGTIFIFALMGVIFGVSQFRIFDAFDPIGEALSDMELTDIVFSQVREDPAVDTNIVVVNIGYIPREMIGRQIEILSRYEPKVIAFDGFFDIPFEDEPEGDSILSAAIANAPNMVMVSKLVQSDSLAELYPGEEIYDSLRRSHPMFRQNAAEGFANLETDAEYQEDFKACRAFGPVRGINGIENPEVAFGVKIAEIYNPEKASRFLERENDWETINYRGNIVEWYRRTNYPTMFFALDWDQVLNEEFVPEMIKDKIVIMGFLGSDFTDTSWDDKFFTPLNYKYAGKANPDMYGVVIHANIVSMILSEDYIDRLGDWGAFILAALVCFLNVVFFSWIYRRLPRWYDGLTKLIQVIELMIIAAAMIWVFHWYNYKLNLTYSFAVVALAGDSLEVYYGVMKNLFRKESRKQLFRLQRKDV